MSVYQWLSDQYFKSIRQEQGLLEKLYRQIRKAILLFKDPAIQVEIYNYRMTLPFSHELPKYLTRYPNYMRNLWLLAGLIEKNSPGLVAIDIGANVGDTVAVIRKESSLPIICVEGNELYLKYLKENTKAFDHVAIAPFYVGDEQSGNLRVISEQGTAKLVAADAGDSIGFKPLSEIYEEASFSARVGLIKVDTDGFDLKILLGSRSFLAEHQPILFFEYDPHLFDPQDQQQYQRLFKMLAEVGYQVALEFDNFGNFCEEISLDNDLELESMTAKYAGQHFGNFCDLAVFPSETSDLAASLKAAYH